VICVQIGHRIMCRNSVGHRAHTITAAHAGCPSAAHICDHYDARSRTRCNEHVYVYTMRSNLHLCITITPDQHRWLNSNRPNAEDALRYLGCVGWVQAVCAA